MLCSAGCHRLFLTTAESSTNEQELLKRKKTAGRSRQVALGIIFVDAQAGRPGTAAIFRRLPSNQSAAFLHSKWWSAHGVQECCTLVGPHLKMAATVLRINQLNLRLIRRPRYDGARYINRMKHASESNRASLCLKLLAFPFDRANVCLPYPPPSPPFLLISISVPSQC